MNITVIGCGYLGAVHASAMAELGHRVVGVDVDPDKVATPRDVLRSTSRVSPRSCNGTLAVDD